LRNEIRYQNLTKSYLIFWERKWYHFLFLNDNFFFEKRNWTKWNWVSKFAIHKTSCTEFDRKCNMTAFFQLWLQLINRLYCFWQKVQYDCIFSTMIATRFVKCRNISIQKFLQRTNTFTKIGLILWTKLGIKIWQNHT
jgi:hypothetical protein